MASRRGIIVTAGILAAVTAASFAVWLIPQNTGTTLITTDYENRLDGVMAIRDTLQKSLDEAYGQLLSEDITPDEYTASADIISNQVTEQIMELAAAEPPAEWVESYSQYIESLRAFNSIIRETAVMAQAIQSGDDTADVENRISELNEISARHAALSDTARP